MLDGRRNAPPGHVEREMTRMFRARERDGVPQWDLPHYLVPLHWDGRKMNAGPGHCISPAEHPDNYPLLLSGLAEEDAREQAASAAAGGTPTLYGYMLVVEAHGVEHGPGGSELEERRFQRDRVERRFHQRPDAEEECMVLAADIDGRFWQARRKRSEPRRIVRTFWPGIGEVAVSKDPSFAGVAFPSGGFPRLLVALVKVAGVVLHGDRLEFGGQDAAVVDLSAARSSRPDGSVSVAQSDKAPVS